jgi:hypothetical protein
MLRAVVLLLLLINGLFYAWGQGWLLGYGWGSSLQNEPQRVSQQIHPELVTILTDAELAKALQAIEAGAKSRVKAIQPVCLMSPVLDTPLIKTLQEVLTTTLPEEAWSLERTPFAGQWMLYMGKYTNPADMNKKRVQLEKLKLPYEVLSDATSGPGFSLGKFESQTSATAALDALLERGVRTAKLVQIRQAGQSVRLRLPAVDSVLMDKLSPVRAALGELSLSPCTVD